MAANLVFLFGAYMHRISKRIILIPRAYDIKFGIGLQYGDPFVLDDYTLSELGDSVILALRVSEQAPKIQRSEMIDILGITTGLKTNEDIDKEWKHIGVIMNNGDKVSKHINGDLLPGYEFNVTKNRKQKLYYPQFHLPINATPEQIGETVSQAFDAIDTIDDSDNPTIQ